MARRLLSTTICLAFLADLSCLAGSSPNYEILALAGTNGPGIQPLAGVVRGPDGNYYGTTIAGGAYGGGAIFKLTPAGVLTNLASFDYPRGNPQSALIVGSDGNLYGTTNGNPVADVGDGTIYRVTLAGQLTILATFPPVGNQPVTPNKLVQGSDGNFYGTLGRGGDQTKGAVFRMTPAGDVTNLVSFDGAQGATPSAGLVEGGDGNFYGTTEIGGTVNNGTAFRITPSGTLTTLFSFQYSSPVGGFPSAELIQGSDGSFYGVTSGGGANFGGAAFKLTSQGALSFLAALPSNNVVKPSPLTVGSDGDFYGTTVDGFYRLTPAGVLTVLVDFNAAFDGRQAEGPLLPLGNGEFLGTTYAGGTIGLNEFGSVHRLTEKGGATPFAIFPKLLGRGFISELFEAANGHFYGTFADSGRGNGSPIPGAFKLNPAEGATPLGAFRTSTVAGSSSRLVQALNGDLYGAFERGGIGSGSPPPSGFVYRITPAGSISTVFQFRGDGFSPNTNGDRPGAGLTRGPDDSLYGTTQSGGAEGKGTFFKIDAARTLSTLASFSTATGSGPTDLIFSDGLFFGLTSFGGANNRGALFSVTTAGQINVIAPMPADSQRAVNSHLILGRDGNFYGAAFAGGMNNLGTVFRLTKAGVFSTVASMDETTGSGPLGVIEAIDGNFYGVTGGTFQEPGAIFRVTPNGVLTSLFRFSAGDGTLPVADLIQASDGQLYGTTSNGGPSGRGVVYRLRLPSIRFELSSIQKLPNGQVRLQGFGLPSTVHTIQATGDLLAEPFASIGDVMTDAIGHFIFDDVDAAGFSRRFYRALRPEERRVLRVSAQQK